MSKSGRLSVSAAPGPSQYPHLNVFSPGKPAPKNIKRRTVAGILAPGSTYRPTPKATVHGTLPVALPSGLPCLPKEGMPSADELQAIIRHNHESRVTLGDNSTPCWNSDIEHLLSNGQPCPMSHKFKSRKAQVEAAKQAQSSDRLTVLLDPCVVYGANTVKGLLPVPSDARPTPKETVHGSIQHQSGGMYALPKMEFVTEANRPPSPTKPHYPGLGDADTPCWNSDIAHLLSNGDPCPMKHKVRTG